MNCAVWLGWLSILLLVIGCARDRQSGFSPIGPPGAQGERVLPTDVSRRDLAIASEVRRVIKESRHLAGESGNVEAVVQNGVVTLRGGVMSDDSRYEMVDRIKRLPGVARVDDDLVLDWR